MSVLICIPTYNEIESLPVAVKRTHSAVPDAEILVIDDASPDGTGELADRLAEEDPRIHVLHRESKNGLGKAYLDGFSWALERGYQYVVEMDADGSHRPEQLPLLLERAYASDAPDLVIGSRWTHGGEVVNWPKSREVLSRGGNLYIKLWLGLPAKDATAGYRVYRTDTLAKIDFDSVESAGYFFQVDMTEKIHRLGGKIVEVPISFHEREAGVSKMSGSIVQEALIRATKLGIAHRSEQVRALVSKLRQK
ncbi:dolichol-phosphate mannosyltransferase [Arcanobacterium wilhelmae]|uniref:Dolichol-phosphate mannosyltransferase n=1 Tax=Arcanobacterium wilhelmae TaxID=1803177 RepID=A0ABT9N8I5_9ACTO|nr:polyprenol monophosphomannose synthase [Arcanobacterium wilhelmae]MDP9800015.1 dolichol-phosphate mannosyltransferase [Arcanobacterium wilhelmae]WFN89512.1 polyprenol monophosphomannose synthase [Arcanobacterium wilhelmae]